MAGKDELPFFKFFPKDWLSDLHVRTLTAEQRGIYIDLLAFDWSEGGIPDPDDSENFSLLGHILGVDADRMRNAWESLRTHYVQHPNKNGWVTNKRLLKERKEIEQAQERRSKAARKAARARWDSVPDDEDDADAMRTQSERMLRASREKSEDRNRRQNTDTENRLPPALRSAAGSDTSVDRQLRELAALGDGPEPVPEDERGKVVQLLVGIWHDMQTLDPPDGSAAKQGTAAKRLAKRTSPRRLAFGLLGISRMWEHDNGRPWDLWDLERKLDNAIETAWRSAPESEESFGERVKGLADEL